MCVCRCSATSGVTAAVTAHDVKLFIHQLTEPVLSVLVAPLGLGTSRAARAVITLFRSKM